MSAGNKGEALKQLQAAEHLFHVAGKGPLDSFEKAAQAVQGGKLSEIKDSRRWTLLHAAAAHGQTDIVKALLDKHGLPVDAEDDQGETALALASGAGHTKTMASLLAAGASPDPRRPGTAGPLHRAAGAGSEEAVSALLKAGAALSVDAGSGTPLFWAAGGGHAGAVRALLAGGADPNARSRNGMTPLFLAAAAAHGAANKSPGTGSETPATDPAACVRALVDAGADVAASSGGYTPLHVAAECGDVGMVAALHAAGAALDARDGAGNTPSELAASWRRDDAADLLLRLEHPDEDDDARAARKKDMLARVEAREAAVREAAAREKPVVAGANARGAASSAPAAAAASELPVPEPEDPSEELAASFKARGTDAFAHGDYQGAVELWSFSLRHATRDATVWANRAAGFLKLGDAKAALVDARVARSLEPRYVKAWYREGLAAEKLGAWEDAALAFFEAYSIEPEREGLASKFQSAIEAGRREHAEKQRQKQGDKA